MWYGKMTAELEKLYDEYYEVVGGYPDEFDDLDYSADEYDVYVSDIKKAIEEKKELIDVVDWQPDD